MDAEQDARTIQLLLRCVQSPLGSFQETAAMKAFRVQYQDIGRQVGKTVYLSDLDKEKIRAILRSDKIDPNTPPDAWRGLTRTDALALGNNEKLAIGPVKRRRVAIKAVRPGQALLLNGQTLHLPARSHVDLDFELADVAGHDWIVVVENWEAFDDLHLASKELAFPGVAPLAVWRGDSSMTRADAMLNWLAGMTQPVAAFVDLDPEGLIIARSLPRLQQIVAPPLGVLEERLDTGVRDRYLAQIAHCANTLDAMKDDLVQPLWAAIRRVGKAYPQEWFVRP